jgi:hypothetical protein
MKTAWLIVGWICISILAFAQDTSAQINRHASDLLTVLLSPGTSDDQWSAA